MVRRVCRGTGGGLLTLAVAMLLRGGAGRGVGWHVSVRRGGIGGDGGGGGGGGRARVERRAGGWAFRGSVAMPAGPRSSWRPSVWWAQMWSAAGGPARRLSVVYVPCVFAAGVAGLTGAAMVGLS